MKHVRFSIIFFFLIFVAQPCLAGIVGAPMGPAKKQSLKKLVPTFKLKQAKDPTSKLKSNFQVSTGTAFDRPLNKLLDTVTGPVAWSLCVMAIVLAGISLVFGADMGAFVQRMIQLALVIGMVSGTTLFLRALFPAGTALMR